MFLELTGEDALTAAEVRLVRAGQRSVAAPTRPEEAITDPGRTSLLHLSLRQRGEAPVGRDRAGR